MNYDAKKRHERYLANREAELAYRKKQHARNRERENAAMLASYHANAVEINARKRALYNRRKQHSVNMLQHNDG